MEINKIVMHEHGVEIIVFSHSLISWFSYKLLYRLTDQFYYTIVIPFTK